MKLVRSNNILVVKVLTEKFGNVKVYLEDSANKVGNGYYVTTIKNKKHLAGFVDIDGNEIIPLDEMELSEFFYTPSYQDICFGFKIPDTDILKYFHVKKQLNGNYKTVMATDPFDEVPLTIIRIKEDPNLWLFQAIKKDTEFAVYSPDKTKIITNFFDEISFNLDDNPYHHIYFCKYIYSDIKLDEANTNRIIHTSLCGFFDKDGNFSSQVFETEMKVLYNSYGLGSDSLSRDYKDFLESLKNKYLSQYKEQEMFINRTINELFNNPNMSKVPTIKTPKKAKIIEFKKKDK